MSQFIQTGPQLANRWRVDVSLRTALSRLLPDEVNAEATAVADELAGRAGGDLRELGDWAEQHLPTHVAYDAWGRRIDRIEVDPAWTTLVAAGQEAGLVAVAHERPWARWSRVVQSALIQLFIPTTASAACPLAMTDAAATALKAHDVELAKRFVPRLTARHGGWTSGQWMTEKEGGSDVSRTSTVAVPDDGVWRLYGTKWFTSATTADLALALARPQGAPEGSRGLSLFAVELRRDDGSWNGIRVRRLKDKLGTRAVPTAELDLDGAVATPVGGVGRGVAKIATMLNIARLWSAAGAVAHAGQLLALARDYAGKRSVLDHSLAADPIHLAWLAELAITYEAALLLTLHAAQAVGTYETGQGDPHLSRLGPTLAKFTVSRQSVDLCSRLIESFGGAGYLEDSGLPRLLRDVHVEVIWEGTTSVLAHDLLRALDRHPEAAIAWRHEIDRLTATDDRRLAEPVAAIRSATADVQQLVADPQPQQGRRLATAMGHIWQAALLVHHADEDLRDGDGRLAAVASRFATRSLVPAPAAADAGVAIALGEPFPHHSEEASRA